MGTIIAYIVIGLIGGAIAKAIMPGTQGGGWLATMLLGIVGALVAIPLAAAAQLIIQEALYPRLEAL